jgi:hypothetical protein
MCRTLNRRFVVALLASWVGLSALPAMGAEITAQQLRYRQLAPGEEPSLNRLLVTPAFLRLDRGERDSGYILFDRQAKRIFSVDPEERSILVIDPPPMSDELAAQAPAIEVNRVQPVEAPVVAGVKPQRWVMTAAGRTCREAFVLPGVMDEAVAAYAEYLQVLARQQAMAQPSIPAEFQDACDSAIHVYAPAALLHKGMILRAWDGQKRQQELLDFRRDLQLPESVFQLPEAYQRIPLTSNSG